MGLAADQAWMDCSINLSGVTLGDSGFLDFVKERLRYYKVPAQKLCFEVTETAAISNLRQATSLANNLQGLGCRLALDDFGSGLSSFSYLKTLPVDFLKIDGMFIRDIAEDPIYLAMVRSINDIGHVMGKQTVAGFVETEQTLKLLTEIGVDFAQGLYTGALARLDDPSATEPQVVAPVRASA
jgi:EAL domain-containing protein (putative c-di-GMP-specific phosphodiesterase class I)